MDEAAFLLPLTSISLILRSVQAAERDLISVGSLL